MMTALNTGLGLLMLLDLAARAWISENFRRELTWFNTHADLVVVPSLLLAPLVTENLAFLRVLRGLRLSMPIIFCVTFGARAFSTDVKKTRSSLR